MKVNTKKETQIVEKTVTKLVDGIATTSNNAELHYSRAWGSMALVGITKAGSIGVDAYFDAEACREVAEFFTNLANVLEQEEAGE